MAVGKPTLVVTAKADHLEVAITLTGDAPEEVVLDRRSSTQTHRVARWARGAGTTAKSTFALSGDNLGPRGAVSTSTHIYVISPQNRRVLAYTLAGVRDPDEDYVLVNHDARGITFVGTDLYVVDNPADGSLVSQIYVYSDKNGTRDNSKEFALPAANGSPDGMTDHSGVLYIPDHDGNIYTYTISSKTAGTPIPLTASNADPRGVYTDGTNIWVTDHRDDIVYVYTQAGALVGSISLDDGNNSARGITKRDDWYVVNAQGGTGSVFVYANLALANITSPTFKDYYAAAATPYEYRATADGVASDWT